MPNEEVAFLGTGPVPAAPYYDPTYYQREREAIFRRMWLHLGRESEIAAPRSFMVRRVDAASASVLVTRQDDGTLRAFHNVCTHRGTELVAEEHGVARSFSCRYHRWNFGIDGSLRAVPDEKSFVDLDKATCGLRPVAVDTCAGFIFVNLDAHPRQTLREYLGVIADELDDLGYVAYTDFAQYSYEIDANWKVAFDNFQEVYHLRWVHEGSTRGNATAPDNPFGYVSGMRFLGVHRTQTLWQNPNPVLTAVQEKAAAAAFTVGDLDLDASREYYCLFPNLFVASSTGLAAFTQQIWPLGPERSRGVVRIYFRGEDRSASMRFAREYAMTSTLEVHVEDYDVIAASHRGIRSGALEHIHFQAQEAPCRHFFNTVDGIVRSRTTPDR